jgi:hypothetical protein
MCTNLQMLSSYSNMICWTLNGIAITLKISVASGVGLGWDDIEEKVDEVHDNRETRHVCAAVQKHLNRCRKSKLFHSALSVRR